MKKAVTYSKIVFRTAVLVFIIAMAWELSWLLWASGITMFFAFSVLEMSSSPSPQIKPNRLYTLEKIISHNFKDHSVVLSYGNDLEIFRCRFLSPFELNITIDKDSQKITIAIFTIFFMSSSPLLF